MLRGTVPTQNIVFTSCPNPAKYGITINASNVTVQNLGVRDFGCAGIVGGPAPLADVTIDTVDASNNGFEGNIGRGVLFANSDNTPAVDYQRIAITNSTFIGNRLVGVDVNVGRSDSVTISGNIVRDNGDSGITLAGASNSTVTNNTVVDNGRYGIEVRNPTGPVTVSNNTVTASTDDTQPAPDRWPAGSTSTTLDYAGIAVYLRGVPQPGGDTEANAVCRRTSPSPATSCSGYLRDATGSGTGQGFGIVLEGTGHTVSGNTVFRNDVGVQLQSGNSANTPGTPGFRPWQRSRARGGPELHRQRDLRQPSRRRTPRRGSAAGTIAADGNWWGIATGPTVGTTRGPRLGADRHDRARQRPGRRDRCRPGRVGARRAPAGLNCADPNRSDDDNVDVHDLVVDDVEHHATIVDSSNTLNEVTTQASTTIPGGSLPATGQDSTPGLVVAVIAMSLGAALVALARRGAAQ